MSDVGAVEAWPSALAERLDARRVGKLWLSSERPRGEREAGRPCGMRATRENVHVQIKWKGKGIHPRVGSRSAEEAHVYQGNWSTKGGLPF